MEWFVVAGVVWLIWFSMKNHADNEENRKKDWEDYNNAED